MAAAPKMTREQFIAKYALGPLLVEANANDLLGGENNLQLAANRAAALEN